MSPLTLQTRFAANARVQAEHLNVTPDLLGMPLASHRRRALAMAIDALLVVLLSSTGEFWIAAGIGALVVQLRRREPGRGAGRVAWLGLLLALLVYAGAMRAAYLVEHRHRPAPAAPASAAPASARADADGDDDADDAPPALAASPAQAASDALDPARRAAQLAARVHVLEAQLAEARKPWAERWRERLLASLHGLGLGFGWAIAYFTLLTTWWRGQTVGKRLCGLRVVELTGKPLTLMTSFGRYGGYAAGMATGGLGFAQVLWDANRQAVQDKLAHTVVVDLRRARAAAAAA
ncbi:MAG: RDD family protein [Burkholderiaceae bacterium]